MPNFFQRSLSPRLICHFVLKSAIFLHATNSAKLVVLGIVVWGHFNWSSWEGGKFFLLRFLQDKIPACFASAQPFSFSSLSLYALCTAKCHFVVLLSVWQCKGGGCVCGEDHFFCLAVWCNILIGYWNQYLGSVVKNAPFYEWSALSVVSFGTMWNRTFFCVKGLFYGPFQNGPFYNRPQRYLLHNDAWILSNSRIMLSLTYCEEAVASCQIAIIKCSLLRDLIGQFVNHNVNMPYPMKSSVGADKLQHKSWLHSWPAKWSASLSFVISILFPRFKRPSGPPG